MITEPNVFVYFSPIKYAFYFLLPENRKSQMTEPEALLQSKIQPRNYSQEFYWIFNQTKFSPGEIT